MSILDRLNGHLDDRALAAIWTDASIDRARPVHPHLDTCAECRGRLGAFSSWLEDLRTGANAEADEVFPAERLAAQQAQILRRIEAAGRPARVIKFPRFAQPISNTSSTVRRWVASAAAAGLLVGVGLGQFMDLRSTTDRSVAITADATKATPPRTTAPGVQTAGLSDEELISRIEDMATPQIPASLMAFDSMTPRARDYPQ